MIVRELAKTALAPLKKASYRGEGACGAENPQTEVSCYGYIIVMLLFYTTFRFFL